MEKITDYLIRPTVTERGVARAWEETVPLPTYEAGAPEKNPIFLEKRVYQGSSGAVYPYPVIEEVSDEKRDKPYRALFLENEYIKVMVLPELGGRIQMAYDKVRQRHFVYYNQVIKPALVGLTGPWISGGIEFNWPQHHRPGTFLPTDWRIERGADGSVTVWCNEVERMSRTQAAQGFTLYPGKAYIEINVRVYNGTAFPQTFLWWANPAVAVGDHYHSVFPPDVHAVFDHGKRDVSNFPIATGVYYKQDYSAGVDISKYKNIPVPTSYMAMKSDYDFVGGYDENERAGLLHVADHHVSPGKKQWTWGHGDFGQAWDRNLTDEDGPYIELMTGVYTDNQPDFSWLQPGEEKRWKQYFMPYAEVGYVKNATKDVAANVEVAGGKAHLIIYATSERRLTVRLTTRQGDLCLDETTTVAPDRIYTRDVPVGTMAADELLLTIVDTDGRTLLTYQAEKPKIEPMPHPAKAAKLPKEIASIEQLFLTGQHLEQYRHATYNPLDYYEEALRREPGDIRCNNAVGLLLMRKGEPGEAEPYFRQAITTQTERNPNPYDGEPYYNLGWCLQTQGRADEAYDAFYKSTWNKAWQDAGYFALARIDCARQEWERALEHIETCLSRNLRHYKALHLKATILRHLGRSDEALAFLDGEALKTDPFHLGCLLERRLLTADGGELPASTVHTYMEYALDYAAAGCYAEASDLLREAKSDYPMATYAQGYFASRSGQAEQATAYYERAATLAPDGCFPNRVEEVLILQDAIRTCPTDAYAYYYLGNFRYAARRYREARECWERAMALAPGFPTVRRNLSLVYFNKYGLKEQARTLLEEAFALDTTDARLFMELDQLYKRMGMDARARLERYECHADLVERRDDLCIERVALYNLAGRYDEALRLLTTRKFHPWEGGEGKVTKQYRVCLMQLARQAMRQGDAERALALLRRADTYPPNLGEGKLANVEENDVDYLKGLACQALRRADEANAHFRRATVGSCEPRQAFYYNDQQPDLIYYQGVALAALGDADEARGRFNRLIDYGKQHLFDDCHIDYFAVSLPDLAIWEDDLNVRNRIHCHYLIGLGEKGLGRVDEARRYLAQALALDKSNIDIEIHLNELNNDEDKAFTIGAVLLRGAGHSLLG
ncbi:MAG: DUF5107 domain-containing protein [Mediterranea sp.]|jgi:tetratricopeptide (TPR) repeat protein|nr:DUF5107 domain-containing protein [Mediterranea sp.]